MPLSTIDEVLAALDRVIATCRTRGSPHGYFAALYRRVTAEVQQRIVAGEFDDGPRMTRFDVIFAQRYLDAWDHYERGQTPTGVWALAFAAGEKWRPVVLQHLLVGMNAHINLDLGIVAAETATGASLHALQRDFDRINAVLAAQVNDVQARMATIWPAVRWLDGMGGDFDEAVINFSIRRARDHAWQMATALADLATPAQRAAYIRNMDTEMAAFGSCVMRPGVRLSAILTWVRLRERGSVSEKIDLLLR